MLASTTSWTVLFLRSLLFPLCHKQVRAIALDGCVSRSAELSFLSVAFTERMLAYNERIKSSNLFNHTPRLADFCIDCAVA